MQFQNLEPGILVSVVCNMWAKNICHETKNQFIGGTRFFGPHFANNADQYARLQVPKLHYKKGTERKYFS